MSHTLRQKLTLMTAGRIAAGAFTLGILSLAVCGGCSSSPTSEYGRVRGETIQATMGDGSVVSSVSWLRSTDFDASRVAVADGTPEGRVTDLRPADAQND